MKKIFYIILIVVLCFSVLAFTFACKEKPSEEPTEPVENPTPTPDVPTTPSETPDDTDAPEYIPVAQYELETVDGVEYIYYGSMVQTAVSIDLANVLRNLVNTNQLQPNDDGTYTYASITATMIKGTAETEGRKLSNGETIVKDELYFFTKESLRWRVLERNGNDALVIAENILGEYYFNASGSFNSLGYLSGTSDLATDYAKSALRTYVTETLINDIFTEREIKSIVATAVVNRPGESAYPSYSGSLLSSTTDKLFVLSHYEVKRYLEVDENLVVTTLVNDCQLALGYKANKVGEGYYGGWWLRSNGNRVNFGYCVSPFGIIGQSTECSVNLDYVCGVRPSMWLRVKQGIIKSEFGKLNSLF